MKEIETRLKKISDELFNIKDEITKQIQDGEKKDKILDEMWNAICGTFAAINRIQEEKEDGQN